MKPSSNTEMNKRGLYDVFTTLMFVIIAVIVVSLALLLSGKITLIKSHGSEQRLRQSFADESFDALTACNKQEVLDADKIGTCILSIRQAKAVRVHQVTFSGCPETIWGQNGYDTAMLDGTAESFPYWVSIQQSDGLVCLARVDIVI